MVAVGSWNLGSRVEVADVEVFAVAKVLEAVAYDACTKYTIIVIFEIVSDYSTDPEPPGQSLVTEIPSSYVGASRLRSG